MSAAKTCTELPGFERPSIKAIDAKFAPYLKLRDQHLSLTTKLKEAKSGWQAELTAQREELEEDSEGNPVYVYQDGKRRFRLAIESGDEKITCAEVKQDDDGAIG